MQVIYNISLWMNLYLYWSLWFWFSSRFQCYYLSVTRRTLRWSPFSAIAETLLVLTSRDVAKWAVVFWLAFPSNSSQLKCFGHLIFPRLVTRHFFSCHGALVYPIFDILTCLVASISLTWRWIAWPFKVLLFKSAWVFLFKHIFFSEKFLVMYSYTEGD